MPKIRKFYVWLPYLSEIKVLPKTITFYYKGGEERVAWIQIHSIMIYGESCDLPQKFFEKCSFYKIPVVMHRRNIPRAVLVSPTLPPDQENLLTQQIVFRNNIKKSTYITKRLLQAKFDSMSWLFPINRDVLYRVTSVTKMRNIEAWHANVYWKKYYSLLAIKGTRRTNSNVIKNILDAVSKFTSGILLRWVLYHNMSPYHGFLHTPTDYPALVYDLMEPYRGYIEKSVFDSLKIVIPETTDEEKILSIVIDNLKAFLDTQVYVEATRQVVTFQELIHGVVLALRAYMLGHTKRFIVPMPSRPNGGRPIKAGYTLYGHKAGITNFWPETKRLAANFEAVRVLGS